MGVCARAARIHVDRSMVDAARDVTGASDARVPRRDGTADLPLGAHSAESGGMDESSGCVAGNPVGESATALIYTLR